MTLPITGPGLPGFKWRILPNEICPPLAFSTSLATAFPGGTWTVTVGAVSVSCTVPAGKVTTRALTAVETAAFLKQEWRLRYNGTVIMGGPFQSAKAGSVGSETVTVTIAADPAIDVEVTGGFDPTAAIAAHAAGTGVHTVAGVSGLQAALDAKATTTELTTGLATEVTDRNAAITAAIAALVDGAPGALDTLNELAAALSDDPDAVAALTAAIGVVTADLNAAEASLGLLNNAVVARPDYRALFAIDPTTATDGTATAIQIIDPISGLAAGDPVAVADAVTAGLTSPVLIASPIGDDPGTWDDANVGLWEITAFGVWTRLPSPLGRQTVQVGISLGAGGSSSDEYQSVTMRGYNQAGPFGTVDLTEPATHYFPDLLIPHAHRVPLMCQRLFFGGGTTDWLDASDGTGVAASASLDGIAVATGTVVWVTHAADQDQCGPWYIVGDPTTVPPTPIQDADGIQQVRPDQIMELTPVIVGNGVRWGGSLWFTRKSSGFRGRHLMPDRPNLAGFLVDGSDEVASDGALTDVDGAVWTRDDSTTTGFRWLRDLAYTPGETADWTGADPATVAEALDRIAAALGPIA